MELEAVEQRCRNYLGQVSNPIAPVDRVLQHVRSDAACGEVCEEDLLGFLRRHEEFRVVEPAGMAQEPENAGLLAEAGLTVKPLVMLAGREPSPQQLSSALDGQLEALEEALRTAVSQAQRARDEEGERTATQLLFRAKQLREKLSIGIR